MPTYARRRPAPARPISEVSAPAESSRAAKRAEIMARQMTDTCTESTHCSAAGWRAQASSAPGALMRVCPYYVWRTHSWDKCGCGGLGRYNSMYGRRIQNDASQCRTGAPESAQSRRNPARKGTAESQASTALPSCPRAVSAWHAVCAAAVTSAPRRGSCSTFHYGWPECQSGSLTTGVALKLPGAMHGRWLLTFAPPISHIVLFFSTHFTFVASAPVWTPKTWGRQ